MSETHLLDCAIGLALDTLDYRETQHAISVLDQEAKINEGGRESAIEVAARVIAESHAQLRAERDALAAALKICRNALFIENESARAQFRSNGELPFDYAIDEADKALGAAREGGT